MRMLRLSAYIKEVYIFGKLKHSISPIAFRFLYFTIALINKGYRAILGQVEFNPLYRKPQTTALHLDYS